MLTVLPPVPTWDGLHPLIIHFPIALLMMAPLFVLFGASLGPQKGRPYLIAALVLMLAGTSAVFIAVETGEAAGKLAERTPEINAVLERHEGLAEQTRIWFSVLTLLFTGVLASATFGKWKMSRVTATVLPILFLLLYAGGTLSLVNTAHNGGTLVHLYGVHAMVSPGDTPGAPAARSGEHGGD